MGMNRVALITGATAGIGQAIAEKLAQEGFDIIITGRRKEKLDEIAEFIRKQYTVDVLPLNFDVRKYDEVNLHIGGLDGKWRQIDVLINNAGLAVGLNPIHEGVIDDWERMIDTNIKGLLYVTRVVSPIMVERKSGHIINLSSIAGKEVYPNGNVYCATKHAVCALTKAMRLDLVQYGIRVSQLCPGAVETEFSIVRFKGNEQRANQVYKGFRPLSATDIADAIYYAVSAPSHIDVQDILVMPTAQASATIFHKEQ